LKNRNKNKYFVLIFLVMMSICMEGICSARAVHRSGIVVLLSQKILPYMSMLQGLREKIETPVLPLFLNKEGGIETEENEIVTLKEQKKILFIAVGPEALSYLSAKQFEIPIIYGMVLNPDMLSKGDHRVSGISLNIFTLELMDMVQSIFIDVKRIGVLFNPESNSQWFAASTIFSEIRNGLKIVPMKVSHRSDIVNVFEQNADLIDALLFIPDSTVISQTIIKHVIKKGFFRKIPAIGYNEFFHESGAALSFILDYKKIGTQVAELANGWLNGKELSSPSPSYKIILNKNVIESLGVTLNPKLPAFVEYK